MGISCTRSSDSLYKMFADKLANMRSMASDKVTDGDQLWERFNAPKDRIQWYYEGVSSALGGLENYPMYKELNALINEFFKS